MNRAFHRVRTRLWSSPTRGFAETIAFQQRAYLYGVWLVRAFYVISVVFIVIQMNSWPQYLRVDEVNPLWPVTWLRWVSVALGIRLILLVHTATALWAMILPQWRSARFAAALALLQYVALVNSFGKVNHDIHAWLWVSAVLVFLPKRPWERPTRVVERHRFLTVLWSAQVFVLFFYALTGLWKVTYAVADNWHPDLTSSLQLDGFARIVAARISETSQDTLIGETLVEQPVLGWLLYTGTMYLEVTSLVIAFRPRLHRLWGLGLIGFHLGTQLAMGFTFRHNVALIGLLFVCSPWAPERIPVRDAFLDLPGVHFVHRRLTRRRARGGTKLEHVLVSSDDAVPGPDGGGDGGGLGDRAGHGAAPGGGGGHGPGGRPLRPGPGGDSGGSDPA